MWWKIILLFEVVSKMKWIVILISGGDVLGMNVVICVVVWKVIYEGFEVYGINYGFLGLVNGDICKLELGFVGDLFYCGGIFFYFVRYFEFVIEEG